MNRSQAHYHPDLAGPCAHEPPLLRWSDEESYPVWLALTFYVVVLLMSLAVIYFTVTALR